jgi:hypothetical protein
VVIQGGIAFILGWKFGWFMKETWDSDSCDIVLVKNQVQKVDFHKE